MMRALAFTLVLIISGAAHAQDVPSPRQLALVELHRMQEREPMLWRQREQGCVGCGIAGVLVGVPVAGSLIPVGSWLLAFASDENNYYYEGDQGMVRRDRVLGGVLLSLGLAGLAYATYGITRLVKDVPARHGALHELRSMNEQRTVLERTLELEFGRQPH